jgi:hypothetical protein
MLKVDLQILGDYLVKLLQQELLEQGHAGRGTGDKLMNSIRSEVKEAIGLTFVEGSMEFYGKFVDYGRRKKVRRVPIFALEEWIKRVNIPLRENQSAKSMAFAIQNKIYNEGIPTLGSKKIASKRTNFIQDALDKGMKRIMSDIEKYTFKTIDKTVENTVREIKIVIK